MVLRTQLLTNPTVPFLYCDSYSCKENDTPLIQRREIVRFNLCFILKGKKERGPDTTNFNFKFEIILLIGTDLYFVLLILILRITREKESRY